MSDSKLELDTILRGTRSVKDPSRSTPAIPTPTPDRERVPEVVMQRLELNQPVAVLRKPSRIYPYTKRVIDFCVAALSLAALSPVLSVVAVCLSIRNRGQVLERFEKVGRGSHTFCEYAFATPVRIVRSFPLLVNVLRGDMSLIGPRALSRVETEDYLTVDPEAGRRNDVRPGLVCDWWIRRHVNIDYVSEASLDVGYVDSCSVRKDFSVVFRSLPGLVAFLLWGDDPPAYESVVSILGIRINNVPMQTALDSVAGMLDTPGTKHACFVNPHAINESQTIDPYRESIHAADLVLADGFGTKLAGKILKRPICQNLCGTDLFPRLCEELSGTQKSIYLLGAAPGVADRVAQWITKHYPDVIIKGCAHGHFSPEKEREVVRKIADSGADLLVVGMGVPRQDIWIHNHIDSLNVKVAMSFGGLFDYFAGSIPRAPQWMREMGFEWVYRLMQEPQRLWRRYLIGNGVFLARVFREKFGFTANLDTKV